MRVAVVSTHPIQYHTPWFQNLASQVDLKVYYGLLPDQQQQGVGFGQAFAWDIPLLEGYDWQLIPNKRKAPRLNGLFRSSTPAIYSLLAKAKPDVLIITGWQSLPLLQALWAAIRLGIPRMVRGDSNALRPRPASVRALHRLLLPRFNAFLSTGKLNRQFYVNYGIDAERIFPAPHFVDNDRFAQQARESLSERDSLRAGWKIADGATCFLFAGKLEPKKRVMDLLAAIQRARMNGASVHLLVTGAGELMDQASDFSQIHNLPVTLTGFLNQTEITHAYAAADCLVLTSDYGETWGLVVNEAMACGLPAIVSDRVGCGPDLVEEGVTGGIFPCGDVNALARKLQEFASDPERLAQMGERARQRIKAYSVESAVAGTIKAIEHLTGRSRRVVNADRVMNLSSPRSAVSGRRPSPRVLHVIPSVAPKDGGPSVAIPLICRGLQQKGIDVDVATTVGAEEAELLNCDLSRPLDRDGVNYFCFRRQSEFYKVSLPLSNWLSQHIRDYDLVHIHALFSYSSYSAARLAAKSGVPYIVRPLGVLNRWGLQNRRRLLKRLSIRFIEKRIIQRSAALHFTSQQERFEAEETFATNQSANIPIGVDLAPYLALPSSERFYERFPNARGRNIILFLSRLDQKKGLDLLLRAFAEVVRDEPRPLLVIAGNGADDFVVELRRLATDLNIADDILWAGFLEGADKLSALKAASLFALPSYSENFGIALVEAMAAGLPSVMSDQVAIAVDATEYDAGLSVPCEVEPLASALRRLLGDPQLRERLGANARRLVEDRFSLEAMSNSLLRLYESVLSRQITEEDMSRVSIDTKLASGVAKAKQG
jgi:glycosyltransferase involved in cell wall biosynthesis